MSEKHVAGRPPDSRERENLVHPFPPTWDRDSRVLLLGSFPSAKSREMAFFYGHPQNRFWRVAAAVFSDDFPESVEERRAFLLRHRIAAWDVIASCSIVGSSDSSIRDTVPNDIRPILEGADIRQICVNGKTAFHLYEKHLLPLTGRNTICLPSTSPANAAWSLERLIAAWSVIREAVQGE